MSCCYYLQSLSLHVHVGGDGTSETVGSENSAAGSINSKKNHTKHDDVHLLILNSPPSLPCSASIQRQILLI